MKQTKQIIQKPIDIDAHLKYRCPQCGYDYWISLREAKTKNFKIVCDCKLVFQPKRVKKIKVLHFLEYTESKSNKKILDVKKKNNKVKSNKNQTKKTISNNSATEKKNTNNSLKQINEQLRDKCSSSLVAYGFTKSEATELIIKAYQKTNIEDPVLLVKQALSIIGEKNE